MENNMAVKSKLSNLRQKTVPKRTVSREASYVKDASPENESFSVLTEYVYAQACRIN